MLTSNAEARAFTLADLPLIYRLKAHGISLDSESYLARGLHTAEDAALSRLTITEWGAPTLVARCGNAHAIGQLRLARENAHARLMFVAPTLMPHHTEMMESAWLALLDGLAVEAGQRGAYTIHAEVAEDSTVFEVLRQAGYASYTSQDIWRRAPAQPPARDITSIAPRRAAERDMAAVRFLHAQTVPHLAQQADPPPETGGLVYFREGKAWSYFSVSKGNRGIFLRPYLHPDAQDQAQEVLASALIALRGVRRIPVYCCIRQYQGWLSSALEHLGFEPWARQTVLVKHTASRVVHPSFASLPRVHGGISISGGSAGEF